MPHPPWKLLWTLLTNTNSILLFPHHNTTVHIPPRTMANNKLELSSLIEPRACLHISTDPKFHPKIFAYNMFGPLSYASICKSSSVSRRPEQSSTEIKKCWCPPKYAPHRRYFPAYSLRSPETLAQSGYYLKVASKWWNRFWQRDPLLNFQSSDDNQRREEYISRTIG